MLNPYFVMSSTWEGWSPYNPSCPSLAKEVIVSCKSDARIIEVARSENFYACKFESISQNKELIVLYSYKYAQLSLDNHNTQEVGEIAYLGYYKTGEVISIYVGKNFRNRGLGSNLINLAAPVQLWVSDICPFSKEGVGSKNLTKSELVNWWLRKIGKDNVKFFSI